MHRELWIDEFFLDRHGDRLYAGDRSKLGASIVQVKIDIAFGRTQRLRDFIRSQASRRPS